VIVVVVVVPVAAVVVVEVAAEASHLGVARYREAVLPVEVAPIDQEQGVVSRIRVIHVAGAPCVEDAASLGHLAEVGAGAGAEAKDPALLFAAAVEIDKRSYF